MLPTFAGTRTQDWFKDSTASRPREAMKPLSSASGLCLRQRRRGDLPGDSCFPACVLRQDGIAFACGMLAAVVAWQDNEVEPRL